MGLQGKNAGKIAKAMKKPPSPVPQGAPKRRAGVKTKARPVKPPSNVEYFWGEVDKRSLIRTGLWGDRGSLSSFFDRVEGPDPGLVYMRCTICGETEELELFEFAAPDEALLRHDCDGLNRTYSADAYTVWEATSGAGK